MNIRDEWRKIVLKYMYNPDSPGDEKYWSPELETCSRDRIKEIQSEKLEIAFKYLWEYSAFYKDKFKKAGLTPKDIKSVDDIYKIPITRKKEWSENQEDFPPWGNFSPLDQELWTKEGWMFFATSGTTGNPRAFRHTMHDQKFWAWNWARAFWAQGVRNGDILINCFGYGPFVAFWGAHYGINLIGCPVIPTGGMDSKRRAFIISKYMPTVLTCTPSYAIHLGEIMGECGYDPRESSIKIIVTAGEPGPGIVATKKRIENLWNARLHDIYGCTEMAMTPLSYTCREDASGSDQPANPHIVEDLYISEAVDPKTLEPVSSGAKGLSVASNLYSLSQPILRYEIGDFYKITEEICICGRTQVRAMSGFSGRADDMTKCKGIVVFPSTFESVIREIPEVGDEFLVTIIHKNGNDELKVKVEPGQGVILTRDLNNLILKKVKENIKIKIGITSDIQIVPFGTLPRSEHKAKRLIKIYA
ncbi:MAG: AMP-binding protein [Thermodesulfobacteriota bacterium]|nr:AMP-binding protein [Thermodesulfobacteriota bacterium]